MKIAIIGYPDQASQLWQSCLATTHPQLHMDTPTQPGCKTALREWMLTENENFLTKHEAWVIDGNYLGVAMKKECWNLTKSSFSIFHHGLVSFEPSNGISLLPSKVRESMAAGPERALTGIYQMILWDGRTRILKNVINGSRKLPRK